MLLNERVAIISGAASPRGIGFAAARLFASQGAKVVVLDIGADAAEQAAGSLGHGHLGISCDVTDADQCRRASQAVISTFGKIDILINNAGVTDPIRVADITRERWNRILDVNLLGTLQMSQAIIPHMRARGSGSIVCMSSVSALRGGGIFGGPHYSAAKAGVLGLAKAMARELGSSGIRVNCLAPGLIQTDITQGKLDDKAKQKILEGIPLGRLGEAQEVAGAYLFLASDLSSYITGATIDVNGGMHIH
jgi:NAD(P)-dependent dehydrogenase (short-subunit alcohol dehydrogenase family)